MTATIGRKFCTFCKIEVAFGASFSLTAEVNSSRLETKSFICFSVSSVALFWAIDISPELGDDIIPIVVEPGPPPTGET